MLALFISSFAIGFGVAIIFGMPPWLIALLGIGLFASVVWYNVNSRWHNRRTISGEGLEDDLDWAGTKYLTTRERFRNRFRGANHKPQNEISRLYPRDDHH